MATIKTIEYRCPHCRKKLPSIPRNDYCGIKFKYYGDPIETCPKCKKTYRNINLTEPAEALTLRQHVPFWITSGWVVVLSILAACITFGVGLIFIIPAYLAACFLTRKRRQEHKNQLLRSSRTRLEDPEYFVQHLFSSVYIKDRSKLTAGNLAVIHARAIRTMNADQVLELGKITHEVLGE